MYCHILSKCINGESQEWCKYCKKGNMLHDISCLKDVPLEACCCLSTDTGDSLFTSPSSNLSLVPVCTQNAAFAHVVGCLFWMRCCRHIKGFAVFSTILLPSALHPQPRCFYWNPPPLKAQHTVRGSRSTVFHIVIGFQNLWVHL